MKSLASAPRFMVALLGITIAAELLQIILFARTFAALLFPILVIALALSALYGSRRAAITMKFLFYFLSVALLISLGASRQMPALLVCRRIAWAALYLVVARYIGASADVANFFKKSQSDQSPKEQSEYQTDLIQKYKQQKKYRIVVSTIAVLLYISSLVFKYDKDAISSLPVNSAICVIILQIVVFVFISLAYIYAKCPACRKYAGSGWSVTKCKNCGERLS